MSIFDRTVTETGDIDPGYLGMLVGLCVLLGAVPCALILAGVHLAIGKDHPLDLVGVAAIIGAAGTAFGLIATGVGVFRRSGQPAVAATPAQPSPISINAAPAAAPAAVPAQTVIDAAGGVEPMPAKIGPEDVGKKTALLEPKRRKRGRKA